MSTALQDALKLELQLYQLMASSDIDMSQVDRLREQYDQPYRLLSPEERRIADDIALLWNQLIDEQPQERGLRRGPKRVRMPR